MTNFAAKFPQSQPYNTNTNADDNNKNNRNRALVLVVDDQQPATQMLCRIFNNEGYDAIPAYDGETALQLADEHVPELILLDVMMPGIDGFEVLRRLRLSKRTANIPTILVTASNDLDKIEQGLNLGADDYIPKPIKAREVVARARSKITARQLQQQLAQRTRDLEALIRVGQELNSQLSQVSALLDLVLYLVIDLLPSQTAAIYYLRQWDNLRDYRIARKDGTHTDRYIDYTPLVDPLQEQTIVAWSEGQLSNEGEHQHGIATVLSQVDDLYGIILLLADEPFDSHNRRLLEGIGRQATLALSNAEAFMLKTNYAEALANEVQRKSDELESAQALLIQSEKQASVGRLAAGIAHEINNPLMPITLNLEDMYEDIQQNISPDPRALEETLNSARRIQRIVERLMQFIRKRDPHSADVAPINLTHIMQNVLMLSNKFFKQSAVSIETDVAPDLQIQGNRDQLEQVFLNLMINARDAMPNGGTLHISGYSEKNNVILRFQDTGQGIPANIKDNIFDPFVTSKADGTGLGLFISYQIIANHNGQIEVESHYGSGATFTIRLPRKQS